MKQWFKKIIYKTNKKQSNSPVESRWGCKSFPDDRASTHIFPTTEHWIMVKAAVTIKRGKNDLSNERIISLF